MDPEKNTLPLSTVSLHQAKASLIDVFQRVDKVCSSKGVEGLMLTGLKSLDDKIGGLIEKDLVLLNGRSGEGKTALAWQWCTHVAVGNIMAPKPTDQQSPVLYCSPVEAHTTLAARGTLSIAGVPTHLFRTCALEPRHWEKINPVVKTLSNAPIFINDRSDETMDSLAALIQDMQGKIKSPLRLVIADGLEHLARSSNLPLVDTLFGLKAIAKKANVAIIAVSTKTLDEDLRSVADKVFVLRSNKAKVPALNGGGTSTTSFDSVLSVERQRVGPSGWEIPLAYVPDICSFVSR